MADLRGYGTYQGRQKGTGKKYEHQNRFRSLQAEQTKRRMANEPGYFSTISAASNLRTKLQAIEAKPFTTSEQQIERITAVAKAVRDPPIELKDVQIQALQTITSDEKKNLIVLAGTGYGKSMIFWLLPFITTPTTPGCVIVLLPLKVLGSEQMSELNSKIHGAKSITLQGTNNQHHTRLEIANGNYTHIFTSPEIALSKGFHKDILRNEAFSSRLQAIVVDELHLSKRWGETFRKDYAKISKLRDRVKLGIPLLGVSATIAHRDLRSIREYCGFNTNTQVLQTSLDRFNIEQCVKAMDHGVQTYLDLQFLLPQQVATSSDIQKTIVYCNTVKQVMEVTECIRKWMEVLQYPDGSDKWVQSYYSWKADADKTRIHESFMVSQTDNPGVVILVATDAYGMGVDNRDVRRVIQYDLPSDLDTMIQRLGRAGRLLTIRAFFLLLVPKRWLIKDWAEVENRLKDPLSAPIIQASLDLGPDNRSALPAYTTVQSSRLRHVLNASDLPAANVNNPDDEDNSDSDIDNEDDGDRLEGPDSFGQPQQGKMSGLNQRQQRFMMNAWLFAYINTARCLRLFTLLHYNDFTYGYNRNSLNLDSIPTALPLPVFCCHRFETASAFQTTCQSAIPEWWNTTPYINTEKVKPSRVDKARTGIRLEKLKIWLSQQWQAEVLGWVTDCTEFALNDEEVNILNSLLDFEDKSPEGISLYLNRSPIDLRPEVYDAFIDIMDFIDSGDMTEHSLLNESGLESLASAPDEKSIHQILHNRGLNENWMDNIKQALEAPLPVSQRESGPLEGDLEQSNESSGFVPATPNHQRSNTPTNEISDPEARRRSELMALTPTTQRIIAEAQKNTNKTPAEIVRESQEVHHTPYPTEVSSKHSKNHIREDTEGLDEEQKQGLKYFEKWENSKAIQFLDNPHRFEKHKLQLKRDEFEETREGKAGKKGNAAAAKRAQRGELEKLRRQQTGVELGFPYGIQNSSTSNSKSAKGQNLKDQHGRSKHSKKTNPIVNLKKSAAGTSAANTPTPATRLNTSVINTPTTANTTSTISDTISNTNRSESSRRRGISAATGPAPAAKKRKGGR